MPRAQAPTHRPAWMIVLGATMLLFGGKTLVGGLLTVRDPGALVHQVVPNVPRVPAAADEVRRLQPALDAIVERHRAALRLDAFASIAFGLFTLYAVAAVLSRDRHGRRFALLTAVFGIAFYLGELPMSSRIAQEIVVAAGPRLPEIMAMGGEAAKVRSQAEQIAMLNWAIGIAAAAEVAWCLVLLRYFGGRRGRELYGLSRDPTRS